MFAVGGGVRIHSDDTAVGEHLLLSFEVVSHDSGREQHLTVVDISHGDDSLVV